LIRIFSSLPSPSPGVRLKKPIFMRLREKFTLYSSVAILTETAQKLREKFGWPNDRITRLLKMTAKISMVLKTHPHIHILSDGPDNRILECALAAKADYIVTGDKHLLSLKEFQDIRIIRLSEFLENIRATRN